ncbi:MAG: polysaccharide biosynthesis tyrosine autokinase [Gemmatimonadetes bacterium]|nr:polysaccharide biosynthesis tyrosine autokinase [Gemmatimonadota bacterium]NIO32621.1 polysaccharide biosynthesis tyrosine autokinase [Gemmatimonadota bacterium]
MISSVTSDDPKVGPAYERVHLEDYWRVIRRRAWLILLTTVVALAAALWVASRQPQYYRSSLTLQVGDPRGRTGQLGDIDVTPQMIWTDPIESEVQQLTTQAVAKFVVDSLQLRAQSPDLSRPLLLAEVSIDSTASGGDYRIRIGDAGSLSIEGGAGIAAVQGRVGEPVRFAAGYLVVSPRAQAGEYTLRVVTQAEAEGTVTGGLASSTRPETNLIDVTYTGRDQHLVPQVLNQVAAAMRHIGVRRASEWARSRTGFIRDRLTESGLSLRQALEAVETYKERRGLTSLESEEDRVLARMATLQTELEGLVIEKSIYSALLDQVGAEGVRRASIQQFAVLSGEGVNRTVLYYYDELLRLLEERAGQLGPLGKDPSHPAIVAIDGRIAETQQHLLDAAENAIAAADIRIATLTRSLDDLQAELRALPAVETELAQLQNEVEIHSDMYKYLLSRYQESQIAEAEISPYVDVMDPALSVWPVRRGQQVNTIFGGLLGLLLGLAAAFFLEYLDRSVQSTSDVETKLGLAVLGWIPRVETAGDGRPIPLLADIETEGVAAEAYRVLRTNLAFSTAREHPLHSLVFTSPGPGEGKSTTVANLAAVLAARGDRALLIDADLRRGELHDAFDLLRSPGLSDLLAGELDPREVIRPAVRPGLDLLPAGKRPPNPSELLGSQAMAGLLAGWRDVYRWVLLDAPPVLAVTDSVVLAALTDGAVLVLRAGETDRRAGWQAIQQLRRVDARIVGAVLNEVDPQLTSDRYYLDYYYARS